MPNSLAYLALVVWPAVAVFLFRRLPYERALVWAILAPYLLLPPVANFDFPLVPPLDKASIPNLAAFAATVFVLGRRVPILPGSASVKLLLAVFVAGPVATVLTNQNPIVIGQVFVPGLPLTDALAEVVKQSIVLLPFFLARRFLATEAAQRELLLALALAGLAYSVPMLLEVRLSPQINVWVWGFFPHAFDQQIRFGGFRPVVFLQHGIWVAFFALMALMAAAALWRAAEPERRTPWLLATGYLSGVLVLCKTVGALV